MLPFPGGAPVARPDPEIFRLALRDAGNLRLALGRIYGNNREDPFYCHACAVLQGLDISLGTLYSMEQRHGFMEKLAPQGSLQGTRKVWSYSGGIRKDRGLPLSMTNGDPTAVRDPTNYCYGVVMRCLSFDFPDQHWLGYSCRVDYNNKTLGDILEAVLGVAWMCRHGHVACQPEELHTLDEYTLAIEQCVVDAERVFQLLDLLGIWTDSRTLSKLLL